jgi:hypothetical protein
MKLKGRAMWRVALWIVVIATVIAFFASDLIQLLLGRK